MSPWLALFGLIPFGAVTASVGWIMAGYTRAERLKKEKREQEDRLEVHRDDLTFELLKAAQSEVSVARKEMVSLREEVSTLRALEQHFFHFQQALDHLEAILTAETPEVRKVAERAAKAFLTRMRRLNEAKGTIRNEVQTAASGVRLAEGVIITGKEITPMSTDPLELPPENGDNGEKNG